MCKGFRAPLLSVFAFISVVMAAQAQNNSSTSTAGGTPSVRVEMFEEYLIGFPVIISIVCDNPDDGGEFYNIPMIDLLSATSPLAVTLIDTDGKRLELPAASTKGIDEPAGGFMLSSGEARRMLFDLSNLDVQPAPGTYRTEADYKWKHRRIAAPTETITFVEPSQQDRRTGAMLRTQNDSEKALWNHFIQYNWRTIYTQRPAPKEEIAKGRAVDASTLSEEGRKALALYLFLHRATYGSEGVSELRPSDAEAFARGPLEGEAAVLRYEILIARDDPSASAERKKILEQFPGLQWRVEAIEDGNGRLARLRRMYGAEQDFATEPDFFPYTEQ